MLYPGRVFVGTSLLIFAAQPLRAQCTGEAQRAFRAREFDQASAAARVQVDHNPRDGAAVYCMGRINEAQSRSGEAVDWFEKAVRLDEQKAEYHLWLGQGRGGEGRRGKKSRQPFLARRVKTEFERAVELDSTSLDARH